MRAAIEGSGGVEETEASKNTILTQAIGSVAIESACLDQVFREVLSDLTNAEFEVGLLFEGQSTEWLTSTCNIILNEVGQEYNRIWSVERVAEFNEAIRQVGNLRDLRNWVVHGTWSTHPVDEPPLPRPWGERDDTEKYYCRRSRPRRIWSERTFTVSDIQHLANAIRMTWVRIARIYREMDNERYERPGGSLPRTLHRWFDKIEDTNFD
jgi:hypothetical protein